MCDDSQLLHFFDPPRPLARVPTVSDSGASLVFRSKEDREVQKSICEHTVNERCCVEVRSVHFVAPTLHSYSSCLGMQSRWADAAHMRHVNLHGLTAGHRVLGKLHVAAGRTHLSACWQDGGSLKQTNGETAKRVRRSSASCAWAARCQSAGSMRRSTVPQPSEARCKLSSQDMAVLQSTH